eukprot:TRINITY_DN29931_c0_g1_i2.p1 TRINITY_DN29931_c0_g1~~TRINITY_DN29931_c0_g1_i2.p1  ORF type:complete len:460 (+),score=83.58 TRINITY_DN29931_c0_g1_i2:505-1884(+)
MCQKGIRLDTAAVNAAITAIGRGGRWQLSLSIFRGMTTSSASNRWPKPDLISYNAAISSVGLHPQNWPLALIIFSELIRRSANLKAEMATYGACLNALAAGRQWKQCLAMLTELRHGSTLSSRNLRPDVAAFTAAMLACEVAGQWPRALELLKDLRHARIAADNAAYGAAISSCATGLRWERAMVLLSEMGPQHLLPSAVVWNAAMTACEGGHEWERALDLLEAMTHGDGPPPDAVSYNVGIAACHKGTNWEAGLGFLAMLQQSYSLRPSEVSFSAAVFACNSAGLWEMSLKLLSGMPSFEPHSDILVRNARLNATAAACARTFSWKAALELVLGKGRLPGFFRSWSDPLTHLFLHEACEAAGSPYAASLARSTRNDTVARWMLEFQHLQWPPGAMLHINISCPLFERRLRRPALEWLQHDPTASKELPSGLADGLLGIGCKEAIEALYIRYPEVRKIN